MAAFRAPLVADPGTRFEYGINTDWLGRVVEAVAGTTFDVVIKEGVTGPLGMDDTMFALDDARLANKTPVHVKGEDGTKPLSDHQVVQMLKAKGIMIARRTVAKYRAELNILPSNLRKVY